MLLSFPLYRGNSPWEAKFLPRVIQIQATVAVWTWTALQGLGLCLFLLAFINIAVSASTAWFIPSFLACILVWFGALAVCPVDRLSVLGLKCSKFRTFEWTRDAPDRKSYPWPSGMVSLESRCSKIPSKTPYRLCVRAGRGRQWVSCWDTGPMSLRSLILSVLVSQYLQNAHLRYFRGHFRRVTCNFCTIRMHIICPLSLLIPNIDSAYWSSLY